MYIKVKVTAGAKKERLLCGKEKGRASTFDIFVKEPAQANRANNKVKELIASYFKVPAKSIRIISGHHSPSKILDIPVTASAPARL